MRAVLYIQKFFATGTVGLPAVPCRDRVSLALPVNHYTFGKTGPSQRDVSWLEYC